MIVSGCLFYQWLGLHSRLWRNIARAFPRPILLRQPVLSQHGRKSLTLPSLALNNWWALRWKAEVQPWIDNDWKNTSLAYLKGMKWNLWTAGLPAACKLENSILPLFNMLTRLTVSRNRLGYSADVQYALKKTLERRAWGLLSRPLAHDPWEVYAPCFQARG